MAVHFTDLHLLRDQLIQRRQKLETAVARTQTANLLQLLEQVDKALERVDAGTYGVCEVCLGTVEAQRLLADPLASICLDCLRPEEARALEADLQLAARIQAGLLPPRDFTAGSWNMAYHYEAAGMVSGDYCDLVSHGKGLYFMVGDVSGKGVAASMLMANLHAMFRVLVPSGLPLQQLVERANRIFCESTLPTQYATLICGKAGQGGDVEICNGGHMAPLHVNGVHGVTAIESSTVPVGLFHDQQFGATQMQFSPGDSLVIYTDGFTEASGPDGTEYGVHRLQQLLAGRRSRGSRALVQQCVGDLAAFSNKAQKHDDQTLMVLEFAPLQH
jgi:sigma-B regulation protein RsbU (phosphoserine phosphatase)